MKTNCILVAVLIFLISCETSTARKPVKRAGNSELEKTVALNKKVFALEQQRMRAYMKLDTANKYINSKKGFWYAKLDASNDSPRPVKGDIVSYEQEITALDGTVLYQKEALGVQSYVVDKEHAVKGLKEGIKLMREGEEVKFIFSSFVAYRVNGDPNQIIGINEPIISTIKLLKINK